MNATFPEQRAAGERAANEAVDEARDAADEGVVVRRWLMLAAVYGFDSPAVAAFVEVLARAATYE
jgi:hypothetical protein